MKPLAFVITRESNLRMGGGEGSYVSSLSRVSRAKLLTNGWSFSVLDGSGHARGLTIHLSGILVVSS